MHTNTYNVTDFNVTVGKKLVQNLENTDYSMKTRYAYNAKSN